MRVEATPAPAAATAARAAVPRLAGGVELIGDLGRSGYRRTPRLVRPADGQTITLTPLLYLTVRAMRRHDDLDRVAQVVSAGCGRRVTADDIRLLTETRLRPLGLLKEPDGSEPELRRTNPLLALTLRVVVSNPRVTGRLSALFAWLFRPLVAVPVLGAFVGVSLWLFLDRGLTSAAHQAFYEPETLLLVWGVTVLSAGFHELGHASACRYGGAKPGVMGAGLYLVWPAFYTDVSDAYRLGRGGRLRVDLGGLYFNAVFALATVAVWWLSGLEALLLVVLAQHLQMLRQLAPFIRADGYHVVADLIGVPDLFGHIRPTLLSMVPRRWGGRSHSALKRWARVVVTTWVLVVVPLLIGLLAMAVRVLPSLAATSWDSVGVQEKVARQSWHEADFAAVVVSGIYMLVVATPVLAILVLLYRVSSRTARRVWRATQGRPRARALALLAGAAVLCATAWSWWPDGQYTAIAGGQRIHAVAGSVLSPVPTRYATDGYLLRTPARGGAQPPVGSSSVPAGSGHPTFYVVHVPGPSPNGNLAYGVVAEAGEPVWVFPFPRPPAPGPGDNQAFAVNTTDGTVATAMAVAWSIVGDDVALERNEAHAYASCDGCAAVAAAFQVLLLVGDPAVVAPVNAAVAASYDCDRCATAAIAVQLVVSVTGMPSANATALIDQALDQVSELQSQLGSMSVEQIYLALTTTEADVMQVLLDDGVAPVALLASTDQATSTTAEPTPALTDSPSDAPSAEGSTSTVQDPSPATSTEPAPEPTASSSTAGPAPATPTDASTGASSSPSEPAPSPTP